jgi:hypothetical protein
MSDWRGGFYAAVAAWLRDREPALDIARVVGVDESIDINPGYSVADDTVEVNLEVRYMTSEGVEQTHSRLGGLGEVIREITAGAES